ncbi:HNH endonuclease [Desertihabitans brevis]|uniref:HNH endonuclease n=1 Tax=Desertihabitans brevis TaxID=2268447 RepID=UPI0013141B50|nr:HNH endonuclease [Desertihabitans brevis]
MHHLVAAAFLGPRPKGMDVAHWDNDGTNNVVTNLRYATEVENMADKLRHGTDNRREHAKYRKLSQIDVDEIRRRYGPPGGVGQPGLESQRSLAAEFGVSQQRISAIVNWRTWNL